MKKLVPLFATIFILQCGLKAPKSIEPDVERFFKVYDALMTITIADSAGLDVSARLDSALHLHAMSKAQFDTTLAFLEKNPDLFIKALEGYEKKANPDSTKSEK